jgi:hypothetical protein
MFFQCFAGLAPRGRRGAQGTPWEDSAGGNTYNLTHVDGRTRIKGAIEAESVKSWGWRLLADVMSGVEVRGEKAVCRCCAGRYLLAHG